MSSDAILTELEYDLLTELFNIGVGRAAASLSQIVKQEIKLSVPSIEFHTINELLQHFIEKDNLISISQEISGPFDMHSLLIFPSHDSIDVVRLMLGEHLSDEMAAELQQEAFTEIGNIVLNACIGIIATTLGEQFNVALPSFAEDIPANVFKNKLSNENSLIMSMQVDLILSSNAIGGYLAFILGDVSLDQIKLSLSKMLDKL